MSIWALPSLFAALVLAWLNFYVYLRRPPKPLWPAVQLALMPPLLYACGDLLSFSISDPQWMWLPIAVIYSGILFIPSTWWLLAHRFAQAQNQQFSWAQHPAWIVVPFVAATIFWLGMITNPWHEQFLTPIFGQRNEYHWMWWIHTITSYTLVCATAGLFVVMMLREHVRAQRARIAVMMAASVLNISANLAYVFWPEPLPFDLTVLGLSVSGLLFLVGIYRIGLFSLNPVAMDTILEHQPNGILVTDLEGKLLYWNAAAEAMLHYPLRALEKDVYTFLGDRLIYSDESDELIGESILREMLVPQSANVPERIFRLRAIEESWLGIRVVSMPSRRGRPIGFGFLLEDQTTRRQEEAARNKFQEQLELSQKRESLGILAGGVAHDFNNLLMAIRGNAELAQIQSDTEVGSGKYLQQIEQAIDRASMLTQQLLSYTGKATTRRRALNLSELAQSIAELLRAAVLPQGLTLNFDFNLADEAWIEGDRSQIEQILSNLILNAAEASSASAATVLIETGVVDVEEEALDVYLHEGDLLPGRFCYVEVKDTGCGISVDASKKIFDPFYTTKGLGRGLGLAAALGIVRSHHGGLRVVSELDKGSTFRVIFPPSEPAANLHAS